MYEYLRKPITPIHIKGTVAWDILPPLFSICYFRPYDLRPECILISFENLWEILNKLVYYPKRDTKCNNLLVTMPPLSPPVGWLYTSRRLPAGYTSHGIPASYTSHRLPAGSPCRCLSTWTLCHSSQLAHFFVAYQLAILASAANSLVTLLVAICQSAPFTAGRLFLSQSSLPESTSGHPAPLVEVNQAMVTSGRVYSTGFWRFFGFFSKMNMTSP